jgi:ubiquitin-protein ligase
MTTDNKSKEKNKEVLKGTALLQEEMNKFLEDPDMCDDFGVDYWDEDNPNILSWRITMLGPVGTIYEGGYFLIKADFDEDYPNKKPIVRFRTKIYHTNVSQKNGNICLTTLNNWEESCNKPSMKEVFEDIIFILCNQNAQSGYRNEITKQYLKDLKKFESTAQEWCRKYANVNDYDLPTNFYS